MDKATLHKWEEATRKFVKDMQGSIPKTRNDRQIIASALLSEGIRELVKLYGDYAVVASTMYALGDEAATNALIQRGMLNPSEGRTKH